MSEEYRRPRHLTGNDVDVGGAAGGVDSDACAVRGWSGDGDEIRGGSRGGGGDRGSGGGACAPHGGERGGGGGVHAYPPGDVPNQTPCLSILPTKVSESKYEIL